MQVTVDGGDPIQVGLGRLHARHFAGLQLLGQRGSGQPRQVSHYCSSPRIADTRNRLPSWSGAPLNACSVVRVSPGTSGRNTLLSGIGCDVAGTSADATSFTRATESMITPSSPVSLAISGSVNAMRAKLARWATCSVVISDMGTPRDRFWWGPGNSIGHPPRETHAGMGQISR